MIKEVWALDLLKERKKEREVTQLLPTLCNPMDCSLPGSSPWDFPGKSTGVGCHFLLQGIFPTQELNPCFPHCRKTLHCLSHQGSPDLLAYVSNHTHKGGSRNELTLAGTLSLGARPRISEH